MRPQATPRSHAAAVDTALAYLDDVIADGGPEPSADAGVSAAFAVLHRAEYREVDGVSRRVLVEPRIEAFFARHRPVFGTTASMQGFVRLKPHGYAGDFEIIERIYSRAHSGIGRLQLWDRYFHDRSGADAVRARAQVFQAAAERRRPRSVASVGCGPALDVEPVLHGPSAPVSATFIDNDANAIRRARANVGAASVATAFVCRNALRFRPEQSFDLIWCSGFLDYLSDRAATHLLRALLQAVNPGGALMVGNFSPGHEGRAYMETAGQWLLVYRTKADLLRLGAAAGASGRTLSVESDATGANLFLVIEP